jgi:amino acid adenylation domain-containing protein
VLEETDRSRSCCRGDGGEHAERPAFAHEAFEAWAAASPGAVAVRWRGETLTYAALNARANALARRLEREGVGPESKVAVCLEPSLDVPVALLAALKAGAAYVPLDPTHPEARLKGLMTELAPAALITRARLAPKLSPGSVPVLALDDFEALTRGCSGADLGKPASPERTAYVYFTSGTTGAPKGAVASQANLAHYLAAARERYALGPDDVIPAIARYSFSISMFELLSPLTCGGTLEILDRDVVVDPERLAKALQSVTLFHAGPSLLKPLTAHIRSRYEDFSPFRGVRHASSGGDMVPPELLEALKEIFSAAEVFVIYGCSEIACMGCTYPVPRERVVERTFVGRPFPGVGVLLLDESLDPVAAGEVGEICFRGEGLVQGYLGRPDLTAEKFVSIGGVRYYRTGDLGRFSSDGWLEMLGRSDFQIKLRGIRVELGEIEHHLRRADGVRDGVVMAMPLGLEEKALVAYVVMDRDRPFRPGDVPESAIRAYMARHLPEYMVPAAFVLLDALPLNHNMKIDRRALPPPERARLAPAAGARRAPRTASERVVAGVFEKVLGAASVGLDDRFFELGGQSLLGLEVLVAVERELGAPLKGLELVHETVEGLAALCDRRLGGAAALQAAAADVPPAARFQPLHFGPSGTLYGVHCGPERSSGEAVLICQGLGSDMLRSQFVARRLAERLAAAGVPSLRFDYYGCGDSLGDSRDAGPARWLSDIEAACLELRRRTGAARVRAVGIRLGGLLLALAAPRLGLAGLTLWDPVREGASFLDALERAHREHIGGWRRLFRPPPPLSGARELLGLTLSDAAWAGLRPLALEDAPMKVLKSADLGFEPGWLDARRVGELLADPGVSSALARLALEGA